VLGPTPMVLVPRDHHCVVRNPALRDDTGAVVLHSPQAHTRLLRGQVYYSLSCSSAHQVAAVGGGQARDGAPEAR
jgi:hypothetical protein